MAIEKFERDGIIYTVLTDQDAEEAVDRPRCSYGVCAHGVTVYSGLLEKGYCSITHYLLGLDELNDPSHPLLNPDPPAVSVDSAPGLEGRSEELTHGQ